MIRRLPGEPDEYLIGAIESLRGAPSVDETPVRTTRQRVVSLRKRFSGRAEYEQWRRARFLITGEWPA